MDGKNLERFRAEYERLHATLRKSHENEKRLIAKCKELNQEIVANAAKIQTALRLSVQDQNSIALLKKELDKAWRMVDNAQDKEKRARETIQRLKVEIQNLSHLVDQGASLSVGQENAVNELLKVKEELTQEVAAHKAAVEKAEGSITTLERANAVLQSRLEEVEKERDATKAENSQLAEQLNRARSTSSQYSQQMVNIQLAHEYTVNELKGMTQQLKESEDRIEQSKQKIKNLEQEFAHMCSVNNELKRSNEHLEQLKVKHDEYDVKMLGEKQKLTESLTDKEKEISQLKEKLKMELMQKQKLESEVGNYHEKKKQHDAYRAWLKEQMRNVLKSFEQQKREAEVDEKIIKELQVQIKKLSAALYIANNKNYDQYQLIESVERSKQNLETDILGYKTEGQELRKLNYNLEKQCEKLSMTANIWHAKYSELQETVKLKETENNELSRQLIEERAKLKIQKNLYEQVRSDCNKFNKQTIQQNDNILELKHKFRLLSQQAEQLKEEIRNKDNALINEHFAYKRLQADLVIAKKKLAKRKEVLSTADNVLAAQDDEIRLLRKQLLEAEVVLHQQERAYDELLQERDILGTQLIRRNDELALLYEKLRIQQSTLSKGEIQYRERLQDLRALKIAINNLKHELEARSQEVVNVEALKNELYYIQRELLQEKTKVKALSEELVNPMNVHRWRNLQGRDPKKYELIQKIQMLQKRLLSKSEEAVSKDMMITELRKQYDNVKGIIGKQNGSELSEQLVLYQNTLKEKTKQLKAMAAELNLCHAQINEYKYEHDKLAKEHSTVKHQLYAVKKQQQTQEKQPRAQARVDPLTQQRKAFLDSHPKVVGGGFSLSATLPSGQAQAQAPGQ